MNIEWFNCADNRHSRNMEEMLLNAGFRPMEILVMLELPREKIIEKVISKLIKTADRSIEY